jgi:hypothetical protein
VRKVIRVLGDEGLQEDKPPWQDVDGAETWAEGRGRAKVLGYISFLENGGGKGAMLGCHWGHFLRAPVTSHSIQEFVPCGFVPAVWEAEAGRLFLTILPHFSNLYVRVMSPHPKASGYQVFVAKFQ